MGLRESDICIIRRRPVKETDDGCAGHPERVASYAQAIAEVLGLSAEERDNLRRACMLHDMGKVRVSRHNMRMLGRLSQSELDILRLHSQVMIASLDRVEELRSALELVKYHQERFDGQGPLGISGKDIPLAARIICIAEAYDILTTDVPWRDAMSHDQALCELRRCSGTKFDPDVLSAFERSIRAPVTRAA